MRHRLGLRDSLSEVVPPCRQHQPGPARRTGPLMKRLGVKPLHLLPRLAAGKGGRGTSSYATSKRSRFITLVHAATKSRTNFFPASALP